MNGILISKESLEVRLLSTQHFTSVFYLHFSVSSLISSTSCSFIVFIYKCVLIVIFCVFTVPFNSIPASKDTRLHHLGKHISHSGQS